MDAQKKVLVSLLPELFSSCVDQSFLGSTSLCKVQTFSKKSHSYRNRTQSSQSSISTHEFRRHYRMGKGLLFVYSKLYSFAWHYARGFFSPRRVLSASHLFPQPGDDTINDKALSRELRFLSFLWYLGTPDSYRSIAERSAALPASYSLLLHNFNRLILFPDSTFQNLCCTRASPMYINLYCNSRIVIYNGLLHSHKR